MEVRWFPARLSEIKVCWEGDELDWEEYEICVKWCEEEGIYTIADLKDRVIPSGKYEKLWIRRCEKAFQELKARRELERADFEIKNK